MEEKSSHEEMEGLRKKERKKERKPLHILEESHGSENTSTGRARATGTTGNSYSDTTRDYEITQETSCVTAFSLTLPTALSNLFRVNAMVFNSDLTTNLGPSDQC